MQLNILDFGARSGGEFLCTDAIQRAVDTCHAAGGGRVVVPAGVYLCGTVWLRSRVELHLENGALIRASGNLSDYNDPDAYEQNFSSQKEKWQGKHLLIALECEDVALTGLGGFDGNGEIFFGENQPYSAWVWREGLRRGKNDTRPGQLLCFIESRRVTVRDISIENQPCWGLLFHGCDDVTVRGVRIQNPPDFQNTDGIDIDSCRRVTVSDCIVDTGDDAIAIRGSCARLKDKAHPAEFITVTGCVLGSSSCGIRIGVGTGAIRHVRMSDLVFTRSAPAFHFMTGYRRVGSVCIEDVSIQNVSAVNCARPLEITEDTADTAWIRNVVIENLYAETTGYLRLEALHEGAVENVVLRNWKLVLKDGELPFSQRCETMMGESWFFAKNLKGLVLENLRITDEVGRLNLWKKPFCFENCTEGEISRVSLNGKSVRIV